MLELNPKSSIIIDAYSDKGVTRDHNEDMILVQSIPIRDSAINIQLTIDQTTLIAVSDGMGGSNAGEIASEHVINSIMSTYPTLETLPDEAALYAFLTRWVEEIHLALLKEGEENPARKGMGATFCALLIWKEELYCLNAGDSRLYRQRIGFLKQLSTDHSLRNQMHNNTLPSNIITNSIGGGKSTFLEIKNISKEVDSEDLLLLCSDGLCDMLSDEEIEDLINQGANAKMLSDSANNAGGKDNISVVILKFSTPEGETAEEEL